MLLRRFLLTLIGVFLVSMSSSVFAITQSQRNIILGLHNYIREQYHLPNLVWDMNIEKQSQEWANTLIKNNVLKHSNSTNNKWMWENLYMITTSEKRIKSDWSDAVIVWTQEWQSYDFDTNTCNTWAICGHFTQVIWKNTKRVGCGQALKKKGSMTTIYWVCQYDPPWNYIGQKPY